MLSSCRSGGGITNRSCWPGIHHRGQKRADSQPQAQHAFTLSAGLHQPFGFFRNIDKESELGQTCRHDWSVCSDAGVILLGRLAFLGIAICTRLGMGRQCFPRGGTALRLEMRGCIWLAFGFLGRCSLLAMSLPLHKVISKLIFRCDTRANGETGAGSRHGIARSVTELDAQLSSSGPRTGWKSKHL